MLCSAGGAWYGKLVFSKIPTNIPLQNILPSLQALSACARTLKEINEVWLLLHSTMTAKILLKNLKEFSLALSLLDAGSLGDEIMDSFFLSKAIYPLFQPQHTWDVFAFVRSQQLHHVGALPGETHHHHHDDVDDDDVDHDDVVIVLMLMLLLMMVVMVVLAIS